MKDLAIVLKVLFGAVLRAFFPAMFAEMKASARDTAEDSRPQPELKARLQNRVRATWGRAGTVGALVFCVLMLPGCGTRTVYVPPGEVVRLRQPVKNAKIWVMDANGNPVPSRMTLPEGWFVLGDPGVDAPETPPEATDPAEAPARETAPPEFSTLFAATAPVAPAIHLTERYTQ